MVDLPLKLNDDLILRISQVLRLLLSTLEGVRSSLQSADCSLPPPSYAAGAFEVGLRLYTILHHARF